MTNLHPLTTVQTHVLLALHPDRWACSAELATDTGNMPHAVRDALRTLTTRRLVVRGGPGNWGKYALSHHGQQRAKALHQPQQMEIA